MALRAPGSRSGWLGAAGAALWIGLLCVSIRPAQAQQRLVVEEAQPGRAEHWRAAASEALMSQGVRIGPPASELVSAEGVAPERLAVLARVESRLRAARDARAQMDEARALRELAAAEADLRADLALPGVSRWLAEVQLHLGVVAAQLEREALARQAFERAAVLDPGRRLQAAEAPPRVVSLAWEAARSLRQQPSSRFRIQTQPAARVFLNDQPLGLSPVELQAVPGRHVLRLEAPGLQTYAALIDALSGERRPLVVQLSPQRAAPPPGPEPARGESPDAFAARVRAYSEAYAGLTVWWVRPEPLGRGAGLWRCERGHCELSGRVPAPISLMGAGKSPRRAESEGAAHGRGRRIWPWIAVGAVLAGGLTAALVMTRPEGNSQQVVVLDAEAARP